MYLTTMYENDGRGIGVLATIVTCRILHIGCKAGGRKTGEPNALRDQIQEANLVTQKLDSSGPNPSRHDRLANEQMKRTFEDESKVRGLTPEVRVYEFPATIRSLPGRKW
jgi:hypothetical protein